MKRSGGFTLIELIVVIVILGILAATALPRFIDFKGDAANAAAQGVAGALGSATAMNYAKYAISPTNTSAYYSPVTSATTCSSLLNTTLIPSANQLNGITATGTVGCPSGAGTVGSCTILNTANGGSASGAQATITCLN